MHQFPSVISLGVIHSLNQGAVCPTIQTIDEGSEPYIRLCCMPLNWLGVVSLRTNFAHDNVARFSLAL